MKYYRVIKDNFLWEVGCILKPNAYGNGYDPVHEIHKKHEGDEYITRSIVENSPDYFQRVYKVDLATRVVYEAKEKAKELLDKQFKD